MLEKDKMDEILSGKEEIKITPPASDTGTPSPGDATRTSGGAEEKPPEPDKDAGKQDTQATADIGTLTTQMAEANRAIRGLKTDIIKERGSKQELRKKLATAEAKLANLEKRTPPEKSFIDEIEDDDQTPFTKGDVKRLAREAERRRAEEVVEEEVVESGETEEEQTARNERWNTSFVEVTGDPTEYPNAEQYIKRALKDTQADPELRQKIKESANPMQDLYEHGKAKSAGQDNTEPPPTRKPTVISTGGGTILGRKKLSEMDPKERARVPLGDLYKAAGKEE